MPLAIFLHRGPVAAADFHFLIAVELKKILAVDVGTHGLDPVEIDDGRAVHAGEAVVGQQRLHLLHGAAQDVRLAQGMHAEVVAGRVDPVDVGDVDAGGGSTVFDRQAARRRAEGAEVLQRAVEGQLLAGDIADQFQQSRAVGHG